MAPEINSRSARKSPTPAHDASFETAVSSIPPHLDLISKAAEYAEQFCTREFGDREVPNSSYWIECANKATLLKQQTDPKSLGWALAVGWGFYDEYRLCGSGYELNVSRHNGWSKYKSASLCGVGDPIAALDLLKDLMIHYDVFLSKAFDGEMKVLTAEQLDDLSCDSYLQMGFPEPVGIRRHTFQPGYGEARGMFKNGFHLDWVGLDLRGYSAVTTLAIIMWLDENCSSWENPNDVGSLDITGSGLCDDLGGDMPLIPFRLGEDCLPSDYSIKDNSKIEQDAILELIWCAQEYSCEQLAEVARRIENIDIYDGVLLRWATRQGLERLKSVLVNLGPHAAK